MGSKTSERKPDVPAKARAGSSTSKQHVGAKWAAKKRQQKWTKDRTEHVRDALNRDADLLYSVLKSPSTTVLPTLSQGDSVVSLAECMQGLGK